MTVLATLKELGYINSHHDGLPFASSLLLLALVPWGKFQSFFIKVVDRQRKYAILIV